MGRVVPRLHVVTDDAVLARSDWLDAMGRVLEAGRGWLALHVRGPHTSGAEIFGMTRVALDVAREHGALVFVNDRLDVALAAGADGVHLGRRSLSIRQARSVLDASPPSGDKAPTHRVSVGVSVHGPDEAETEAREGADYLFAGTIFPTPSHGGLPGIGPSGLHEAVQAAAPVPCIAIGGVSVGTVAALMKQGAHGVAVIRGVWDASDPAAAVREYMDAIEEAIDEE